MFSAKSRLSGFFQAAGLSVVAGVCGSFHVLAATGVPTTAAPLVQPSYFESEDIFWSGMGQRSAVIAGWPYYCLCTQQQ